MITLTHCHSPSYMYGPSFQDILSKSWLRSTPNLHILVLDEDSDQVWKVPEWVRPSDDKVSRPGPQRMTMTFVSGPLAASFSRGSDHHNAPLSLYPLLNPSLQQQWIPPTHSGPECMHHDLEVHAMEGGYLVPAAKCNLLITLRSFFLPSWFVLVTFLPHNTPWNRSSPSLTQNQWSWRHRTLKFNLDYRLMGHWRLGFTFPFALALGYKYVLQVGQCGGHGSYLGVWTFQHSNHLDKFIPRTTSSYPTPSYSTMMTWP